MIHLMLLFLCCVAGIMAGAPCPPEVVRDIISKMGIKQITVSQIAQLI